MKILIVDDNKSVLRTLKLVLEPDFGQILTANNPQIIPALLMRGDVDAVILDMNFNAGDLDGKDGLFWLERIKEMDNAPAVVMLTAFGDIQLAVESMKQGADDFVTKPWDNENLKEILERAIAKNRRNVSDREKLKRADALQKKEAEEKSLSLEEMKLTHIKRIIKECGGNLSQASQILGVNRQTLYNQLRKENEG